MIRTSRVHARTRIAAVCAAVVALLGSGTAHANVPATAFASAADHRHAAYPSASALAIAVHPDQIGNPLRPGFIGLSFGAATLAADDYAATDLAGYLRTLGRGGILRIGGNSGDGTFWTSTGETAPSWAAGTITPQKLIHLAAVARAADWRVVLAVNLKHPDAARAADEARYAQQIFGRSLLAIEIGNEPNFYYSSETAYFADFHAYAAAIEQAAPGVRVTGPDAETNHQAYLPAFAADETANPTPGLAEITDHTYPLSVCGGQTVTAAQLLGTGAVQYESANADALVSAARALHVTPAMTETNSVVCAGEAGVSDAFASSLWALDYSLLLAQHGVANAQFMDGTNAAGCDPYTPLCPTTGDLSPRPIYYGMLAASLVGSGAFVGLTNPDAADVRAYAVREGRQLTLVLDDVQDPATSTATTITLNLGTARLHDGRLITLTTSDPAGLAATGGITLGGRQVGPHGAFLPPRGSHVNVRGSTAMVTVQPGSAVIIRFD
jgi:hypothetical protein